MKSILLLILSGLLLSSCDNDGPMAYTIKHGLSDTLHLENGKFIKIDSAMLAEGTVIFSGESKKEQDSKVILVGRDLNSGLKRPLLIDSIYNVYSPGDTVWVYRGEITAHTWRTDIPYDTGAFSLFVLLDR